MPKLLGNTDFFITEIFKMFGNVTVCGDYSEPRMVTYTCNPSILEAEARGLQYIQSQPELKNVTVS
ncbi:hypothetical protein ACQP3D_28770, partial [Escherichia coli]